MTNTLKIGRMLLLDVLLAIVLFVFLIGNTAGVYVTGTINSAGLRSACVTRLMDTVYDNLGTDSIDTIEKIQTDIEARSEISSITEKYTEAFIEGIWEGRQFEDIEVDISEETDSLIDFVITEMEDVGGLPSLFTQLISQLLKSQTENLQKAIQVYAESIYEDIQSEYSAYVKLYYVMTSQVFLGIMLALIIILAIALIATTPFKVSKINMPVTVLVTGAIYYIIANVVAGRAVMTFSNRLLGRTVTLDTSRSITMIAVMAAVAVALFVVMFVAEKVRESYYANDGGMKTE